MKLNNIFNNPLDNFLTDQRLINATDLQAIEAFFLGRTAFISAWCFRSTSLKFRSGGFTRVKLFLKHYEKLLKKHGDSDTILILKSYSVLIQKSIGRDYSQPTSKRVKTLLNFPSFISRMDIQKMRGGDVKLIQFWLTILSIYRILEVPGTLKLETITNSFTGIRKTAPHHIVEQFGAHFLGSQARYSPVRDVNLLPLWKASSFGGASWSTMIHSYLSLPQQPFAQDFISLHQKGGKWHSTTLQLLDGLISFLPGTVKEYLTPVLLVRGHEWSLTETGSKLTPCPSTFNLYSPFFGRLAEKAEAAGKIRVFAMVDYLSQVLLKPFHDFLFALLKDHPYDGTFDQQKTVRRIKEERGNNPTFSFDLSAATDRLPLDLQIQVLTYLSSAPYAKAWGKFLTGRSYYFRNKLLYYAVGQPMGALSSWASLAVTHHFLVWWACHNAGLNPKTFNQYAVLGDDICIWHKAVANCYLSICREIGLEINLSKSIVSYPKRLKGQKLSLTAVEFAKRTLLGVRDVSPLPLKLLLGNGNEVRSALFHYMVDMRDFSIPRTLSIIFYPHLTEMRAANKTRVNLISTYKDIIGKRLIHLLGQLTTLGLLTLREYFEIQLLSVGNYQPQKYLVNLSTYLTDINPQSRLELYTHSVHSIKILRSISIKFTSLVESNFKEIYRLGSIFLTARNEHTKLLLPSTFYKSRCGNKLEITTIGIIRLRYLKELNLTDKSLLHISLGKSKKLIYKFVPSSYVFDLGTEMRLYYPIFWKMFSLIHCPEFKDSYIPSIIFKPGEDASRLMGPIIEPL